MGAAASVISWKKKEIYSVDLVLDKGVKVFSKAIFKRYEWITLKSFSQRYKIAQKDLVRVFTIYLSHDEVYLREFRIKTMDPRNRFLHQTKLMQVCWLVAYMYVCKPNSTHYVFYCANSN